MSATPGYAQKPLWTPEDVVTYPNVALQDVSSDGKYTLMLVFHTFFKEGKFKGYSECVLVNNKNLKEEKIGSLGRSCLQPQFIAKGKLFSYIIVDKDKDQENSSLWVKEVFSDNPTKIQQLEKGFSHYTFAPDGKSYAFTYKEEPAEFPSIINGEEKPARQRLYLQKVNEDFKPIGKPRLLSPPDFNLYTPTFFSFSYAWSPDSQKIAFTANTPVWKSSSLVHIYVIDINKKNIEEICTLKEYVSSLKFSSDGQKLAFLTGGELGEQTQALIKPWKEVQPPSIGIIDLKTKHTSYIPAVDLWNILGWTEDGSNLIVTKQDGTKQHLHSVNLETKKLTYLEAPHIPSINNAILRNYRYLGFEGQDLHHPSEVYFTDLNIFAPKKISSVAKGIDLSAIQAHPLKWKSFDGLEIEGILVYPQEYKKGSKVPLIVSLHGGPSGVESERFIGDMWFDYCPAVFASLGYASLIVNYRGSLGYGMDFQTIDYLDLGGGDFKDIMAGVDFLIDQGIADPDHLFIRGHSYGGFLSAWTIGQTHRFKAASISSGIVDWISHIATTDAPVAMESYFGGVYWDDYKLWRKTDPLSYINNIHTPTLIFHGLQDRRVSPRQAEQIHQALRKKGIPTRLVFYRNEGHDCDGFLAIIDELKELIAWFGKYGQDKNKTSIQSN